jgi:hypothetical protein
MTRPSVDQWPKTTVTSSVAARQLEPGHHPSRRAAAPSFTAKSIVPSAWQKRSRVKALMMQRRRS